MDVDRRLPRGLRAAGRAHRSSSSATRVRRPRGADVLVTDIWVSSARRRSASNGCATSSPTGSTRRSSRSPSPEAIVLHCLPAHPGEEISPEVLYGPRSAVWDEAENRLHVAEGAARAARRLAAGPASARAGDELVLDRRDVDPARGEQHVEVVDRGRRPRRRRARRSRRAQRGHDLDRLLADLARNRRDPCSSSSSVYDPSGRSSARSAIVRQSAGAKHESEPVWQAGPAGCTRIEQRVAVAVVAQLLDRHACCPRSRPCASTPRASGSRTTPRRFARAALGLGVHPGEHQHAARSRRPGRSRDAARPQAASRSFTPSPRSSARRLREPLGILVQDRGEQRRLGDARAPRRRGARRRRRPRRSPAPRPPRRPHA